MAAETANPAVVGDGEHRAPVVVLESVTVSQIGKGSTTEFLLVLILSLAVTLSPSAFLFFTLIDPDAPMSLSGFVLMIVAVALLLASLFGGVLLCGLVLTALGRWNPRRDFSGTTRLTAGPDGLDIAGFATFNWSDVMFQQGIPDSDTALRLETGSRGALMVQAAQAPDLDALIDAIRLNTDRTDIACSDDAQETVLRAQLFKRSRFRLSIAMGYGLGAAVVLGVISTGKVDTFITILALPVLFFLIAWLMWAPSVMRLTAFPQGRLLVLRHDRARGLLMATDGRSLTIDTWSCVPRHLKASGIGYSFEYLGVRTQQGSEIFLIPHEAHWPVFMKLLGVQLRGFD